MTFFIYFNSSTTIAFLKFKNFIFLLLVVDLKETLVFLFQTVKLQIHGCIIVCGIVQLVFFFFFLPLSLYWFLWIVICSKDIFLRFVVDACLGSYDLKVCCGCWRTILKISSEPHKHLRLVFIPMIDISELSILLIL